MDTPVHPHHTSAPPARALLLLMVGMIALGARADATERATANATAADDQGPAGWMAALDLHALTSGRIGAWIARLAQDERIHARLAVARASSGVDLLHDLNACCACGDDADAAGAVASISGRFERARIETLVLASPGGAVEPIANGRLLMVPHAAGGTMLYALLDRSCARLVLGIDRARVVAAQADPPQVDAIRIGALLEPDAAATPLGWAGCARIDAWRSLPAAGEPARAVASAQVLIEERAGMLTLRAALVATSADAAARYGSLVNGLCDLAQLEPHVRLDPALEALLASRALALHGRRLDFHVQVAIDLAERCWTPKILAAVRE